MSRRKKMITGCLAHIKTKSHLACNKMTLGPSENFAGSSRSSSADLSLVPVFTVQHCNIAQQSVFNIAISLNMLQLSFPIYGFTARTFIGLTAHLIGIGPPWPKANLSTKGAVCNFTYVPHSPRAKWVSNLPRLRRFATDLRFSSAPVSTDLCVRPMCALWVYFMDPVTRNMHWATRDLWLHDQNILLVHSWSKFARGLAVAKIIVVFSCM